MSKQSVHKSECSDAKRKKKSNFKMDAPQPRS
jgi:hypothetical protein